MNTAVYAMQTLQKEMQGEAEKTNLTDETDIDKLIEEIRSEDNE